MSGQHPLASFPLDDGVYAVRQEYTRRVVQLAKSAGVHRFWVLAWLQFRLLEDGIVRTIDEELLMPLYREMEATIPTQLFDSIRDLLEADALIREWIEDSKPKPEDEDAEMNNARLQARARLARYRNQSR